MREETQTEKEAADRALAALERYSLVATATMSKTLIGALEQISYFIAETRARWYGEERPTPNARTSSPYPWEQAARARDGLTTLLEYLYEHPALKGWDVCADDVEALGDYCDILTEDTTSMSSRDTDQIRAVGLRAADDLQTLLGVTREFKDEHKIAVLADVALSLTKFLHRLLVEVGTIDETKELPPYLEAEASAVLATRTLEEVVRVLDDSDDPKNSIIALKLNGANTDVGRYIHALRCLAHGGNAPIGTPLPSKEAHEDGK